MKKWNCKNGKEIEIKDMETSHIENSIKMLERQGFVAKSTWDFYSTCSGPTGEHAQDAFEAEQNSVFDKMPTSWIDAFKDELKKRNESKKLQIDK